jgi:hypothetical protein
MREQVQAGAQASTMRTFTDEDGNRWEVVEVDGATVPAARGKRCLIFRAAHAVRRVWSYPPEWASLCGAELARLSWRR